MSLFEKFAEKCGVSSPLLSRGEKSIRDELNVYRSLVLSKSSFEQFWTCQSAALPKLFSVIESISFIPAASVARESSFSIANYVHRKERSSLSYKNIKYTMLCRDFSKVENLLETQ